MVVPCAAPADGGRALAPSLPPAAMGDQCVEPVEVMRRDHMRLLLHQRDETVHEGVRGSRHSLVGCIDCHASRDARGAAIPVNAPGQFCETCHSFAGVSMDCFECHATVPADAGARTGLPSWMSMPPSVSPGALARARDARSAQ